MYQGILQFWRYVKFRRKLSPILAARAASTTLKHKIYSTCISSKVARLVFSFGIIIVIVIKSDINDDVLEIESARRSAMTNNNLSSV